MINVGEHLKEGKPDISDSTIQTGLTFQSQNGVTGGPSRILQPLTRFTANKTHGRMHFVPPERTYLKLHNPNKLTVQEMQVDIVNSDEKVVKDLQAHTYVALHIR